MSRGRFADDGHGKGTRAGLVTARVPFGLLLREVMNGELSRCKDLDIC